ncbi:hypothetical protein EFK50_20320 [Nocardioides marmoriginsengisoli]|uniref:Endonuclease/exonuclease/phosphatase domain-containing protein n=2 Tax=Nocardioides marmoriginsengisoli TaxID=661483 RepID=A0A3N0CB25_9ACTN|nr:hypothetical protein EFK50_20320 [Nocardioides marmoriginsengisoli]
MGGDVLPALSGPSSQPNGAGKALVAETNPSTTTPSSTPSPTATATTSAPPSKPSKVALSAEALASSVPVGGPTLEARPMARRSAPPTLSFRLATYNILGSSHTGGGAKSGPARASRGTQYVLDHGFSVVGFQEMQSNQRSTFLNKVNNTWGLLPGGSQRSGDGDNSIAWRKDTWQLVKADSVSIPYFSGKPRNIPVLLLRHKQTGIEAWFTNFHNPADKFGNAQKWRNIAKQRQVALFNDLAKTGRPIFVTGDMNERRSWACDIVTGSDMKAAAGGDGRNGCSVQTNRVVDWIAGSYDVEFSNYYEDRGPVVDYLTDHPIIGVDVKIDSRDFPRAVQ